MKYIKTFENNTLYEPKFKNGDYVKCIDEIYNLKNYKIYVVEHSYKSNLGTEYVDLENVPNNSYFCDRFILATPEEIENYNMTKNVENYNL